MARQQINEREIEEIQFFTHLHMRYQDEIMANWTLAVEGTPIFPIEPLK